MAIFVCNVAKIVQCLSNCNGYVCVMYAKTTRVSDVE